MTRLCLIFPLAAALSGCGPEPRRGVQYWLDHPHERFVKLAECRDSAAADAEHNARFRAYWIRKVKDKEEDPWLTSSR